MYEVDGYFAELEKASCGRQRWLVREIHREHRRVRGERDAAREAARVAGESFARGHPPDAFDLLMRMRAAQREFYARRGHCDGGEHHMLLNRALDLEKQADAMIEQFTTRLPLFDREGVNP